MSYTTTQLLFIFLVKSEYIQIQKSIHTHTPLKPPSYSYTHTILHPQKKAIFVHNNCKPFISFLTRINIRRYLCLVVRPSPYLSLVHQQGLLVGVIDHRVVEGVLLLKVSANVLQLIQQGHRALTPAQNSHTCIQSNNMKL